MSYNYANDDGGRAPVTPAAITEVADIVAERVRGARTS